MQNFINNPLLQNFLTLFRQSYKNKFLVFKMKKGERSRDLNPHKKQKHISLLSVIIIFSLMPLYNMSIFDGMRESVDKMKDSIEEKVDNIKTYSRDKFVRSKE
ncbi:hypothetical protein MHBO_001385 [Bonamia ostreae]